MVLKTSKKVAVAKSVGETWWLFEESFLHLGMPLHFYGRIRELHLFAESEFGMSA